MVRDASNGFTIVKNEEGLYNYVDNKGKLLSDKWFDRVGIFKMRDVKISAYVEIEYDTYWLFTDGELIYN